MPRDSRLSKNYLYPKGKLNRLFGGALFGGGTEKSLGGSGSLEGPTETGDSYDQMLATNSNEPSLSGSPDSVSSLSVPQYQKPGFFNNLLSGGRANQNYNALTARTGLDVYNNQARELLQQQSRQAAMDELAAKQQGDLSLLKTRIPLEESSAARLATLKADEDIRANLAKTAQTYGLSPDELHEVLGEYSKSKYAGDTMQQNLINSAMGTPDGGTAVVNNWYSQMGKQSGDNSLNSANAQKAIADSQSTLAQIPTKRFINLSSGDSAIDPTNGKAYFNAPSSIQPFEVKGGPTMTPQVPGYSTSGGPRKAPGGVAAELGQPPSAASFTPLPSPNTSSPLPYFSPAPQAPNGYPAAYQPYSQSLPQQPAAPIVPTPQYPTNSTLPDANTRINDAITNYLRRLQFPNGFPQ